MASFGFGDGGSPGHDEMDDAEGGGLLTFDGEILDSVSFELTVKAPV